MNMCSVRHRPMPSAPNSRARRASSGVSALARTPERAQLVAPAEHGLEARVAPGRHERHVVERDCAGRAVDRDQVALAQHARRRCGPRGRAGRRRLAGAGDGGAAHAAGDERRVRGLAALGGEDALGRVEAGDVVGLGERPHEDHRAAVRGRRDRLRRGEDDRALGGAGRGGDAAGDDLVARRRGERRVQQRVERAGVDRRDRLLAASAGPRRRRRRRSAPRPGRALGAARLEHVQAARPRP